VLLGILAVGRRMPDEPSRRILSAMQASAERGSEIVKQLMTFARGGTMAATTVDPRDVLQGIEKLLQATRVGSIELEVKMAPALAPIVADPTQLQQVLLNLCVNARDAMPSGGRLEIHADNVVLGGGRAGAYVRLRVADTGQGMRKEVRERMFEPFFTTKAKGTGIGLSTVFSIVKQHGGFIEVDSEVGEGTEFRIYLPAARPRAAAPRPAATGAGRLLLLVDRGAVRELKRGSLEACGHRVVCVETPEEALRELGHYGSEIAAVLVHQALPELGGAALAERLSTREPHVPVIDTSGLSAAALLESVASLA
jgi:CheY-like chemotaxis protein